MITICERDERNKAWVSRRIRKRGKASKSVEMADVAV